MQNLSKLFLCQLASLFKEAASLTCQHAFPAAMNGAWSCHSEPHPAHSLLHAPCFPLNWPFSFLALHFLPFPQFPSVLRAVGWLRAETLLLSCF